MDKNELKRVKIHDVMSYKFLSSPRFSPDGNRVAFMVHNGDLDGNRYISCIYVYDIASDKCRQLTSSGSDGGAFAWSADGSEIIFTSNREPQNAEPKKADDEPRMSRIYSIPADGGEARFLASCSRTVTELTAISGGRLLMKTVDMRKQPRFEDADYMIFEQIPFNANGKGFTEQRRTRLSILDPKDGTFTDLTHETLDVGRVRVTADGARAILTGCDYTDVLGGTTGVWEADLSSGTLSVRVPQNNVNWECAAEIDGGRLLLAGTDMKKHGRNENRKFYIADGSEMNCITPDFDRSMHNSICSDCRYGPTDGGDRFELDGGLAWFTSTDETECGLYTVDMSGEIKKVSDGLGTVDDWDMKNGRAAVIGTEGMSLQELYIIDKGDVRRMTDFNTAALQDVNLSVPEYVRLENGTPYGLDCWYMRPVGFEVGRKYPTILDIHGGPKMTFGRNFIHEMQCWAAEGFAVLFCNPRGSDGKGGGFDDIRGDVGGGDYDDIMSFVDWAVKTLPFVDADRMGVTGGSYGGYMTNMIIGRTNRFRAAVTQRSISNWISMLGMSDIGYLFVPNYGNADIGTDISALWDRSPLKNSGQMMTPTLIIHSDDDQRCELGQGLQLFTALKRNGVDARMCVFKGENHELSRSGHPKSRLARLQEIMKWFKDKL